LGDSNCWQGEGGFDGSRGMTVLRNGRLGSDLHQPYIYNHDW